MDFENKNRKALLSGLSPKKNRVVPPLIYERVYQLKQDFPHLHFTLNGGLTSYEILNREIENGITSFMIGR